VFGLSMIMVWLVPDRRIEQRSDIGKTSKRRSNEDKSHVDTERGKKSLASFDAFSKQTVYVRRKMAR
jgi:hypothetical protein